MKIRYTVQSIHTYTAATALPRPPTSILTSKHFLSHHPPSHHHHHHHRCLSTSPEVAHEFRFFRVLKNGTIQKFPQFFGNAETIPPSEAPTSGIRSKDITISSNPAISARVFIPESAHSTRKLPLLFYVHGGGFTFESAFSPQSHTHLVNIVSQANVVAISIEYRLALEHPIPACYEDCWAALNWVATHANGAMVEPWLDHYADYNRVFLAGDSAGGNICHTLVARVGDAGLPGVRVVGVILSHPYFGGTDDDRMWLYLCPENEGLEDPRLKPGRRELAKLGCERVMVFVAEEDHLRDGGVSYCEELKKSGWGGVVELMETKGEDHCFHLTDPGSDKAVAQMKRLVSFLNQD